jgi:hypothetical protein
MSQKVEFGFTSSLGKIYKGMKKRCYQLSRHDYKGYGGKGIKVCEEWKHSYVKFREWALSHGYLPGLSIDRLDSKKDYCPENCQWLTKHENETKHAKPITAFGETKFIWEWKKDSRCINITTNQFHSRVYQGWTPEEALTIPVKPRKRKLKTTPQVTQKTF